MNSMSVFDIDLHDIGSAKYMLLAFKGTNVILNLISLHTNYNPIDLITLQDQYQANGIYLLHLWEDVWESRKVQVIGRIASILGLNKRIHARKTTVISITQKEADDFLNEHHLLSSVKSKYKFALTLNNQIVAVACFSNLRLMKTIAADYRSAEVIRFASRTGYTVTGGFSKLLKHFINRFNPNDIMSYADRDWSLGKAYEQSGFKLTAVTPSSALWLNRKTLIRYFPHRLPLTPPQNTNDPVSMNKIDDEYLKIFNTGNLKFILYL